MNTETGLISPEFEFIPFRKIPRYNREVIVTEKIDGTNACVYITNAGNVLAGKRTGWCTPEKDNFGFAAWVRDHEEELRAGLGPGLHYGEWWGAGIQRRYGLAEKRFSLFNVTRWEEDTPPECCAVVPVLWRGLLAQMPLQDILFQLREYGSSAVPGFRSPEGIVIFHVASGQLYKVTLEGDDVPKGVAG